MNKFLETAIKFTLEKAAVLLANHGINSRELRFRSVDAVIAWIVEQEKTNKAGWEKMDYVISQFNVEFAERASWVVRTVAQIAFAIAKFKKLI